MSAVRRRPRLTLGAWTFCAFLLWISQAVTVTKLQIPFPCSFPRSGVFFLVHTDQRLPLSFFQCAPGPAQPAPLQGTNPQCSCCQSGSFKLETSRPTMCQCLWKTWLDGFINARKWNGKCQYVCGENVSVQGYWRMAFHRELLPLLFSFLRMPSFFQRATFKHADSARSWVKFILSTTPPTSIELHQHLSHLL